MRKYVCFIDVNPSGSRQSKIIPEWNYIGNFCDKNKDQLNIDCINLLKSSSNLILEKYQNKNEKKYGYEVRDALRKKILNKMNNL